MCLPLQYEDEILSLVCNSLDRWATPSYLNTLSRDRGKKTFEILNNVSVSGGSNDHIFTEASITEESKKQELLRSASAMEV